MLGSGPSPRRQSSTHELHEFGQEKHSSACLLGRVDTAQPSPAQGVPIQGPSHGLLQQPPSKPSAPSPSAELALQQQPEPGPSGLDAAMLQRMFWASCGRLTAAPHHSLLPLSAKPQVAHSSKSSCSFVLWAALASTVTLGAPVMGRWWKSHPRGGQQLWALHSTQGDIQDEIKKPFPKNQTSIFQRFGVLLWQSWNKN